MHVGSSDVRGGVEKRRVEQPERVCERVREVWSSRTCEEKGEVWFSFGCVSLEASSFNSQATALNSPTTNPAPTLSLASRSFSMRSMKELMV